MSDSTPEDRADAIKDALFAGNKIQAIKLYRVQTNTGLAEAKEAVERLEVQLRASSPERFTKQPSQGKGCFAVALTFVTLGTGLVRLLS